MVFLQRLTFATLLMVTVSQATYAGEPAPVQGGQFDIRDWGAVGDGGTDATPHFKNALNAIGGAPATLAVAGGAFAVESLAFPENVTLVFRDGGLLAVAAEHEVAIHGRIDAGLHRIFSGEGTVAGRTGNLHVFPQWFGAAGDGVRDDTRALQQAADLAATAVGRTLFVPEGQYSISEDLLLRCNVENRGLFLITLEIDENRTRFSNDLFLPTHYPKRAPVVEFAPDHPEQELDAAPFLGIREGDSALPAYRQVALADGGGRIDLAEGGVLRFYSSDFFSSRNVRKGEHYYDRNDICQVVSGRGDVFPEFAFDYPAPPEAAPWDEGANYAKGDYCTRDGEMFKATWPSGPGAAYRHRHLGEAAIGPVPPENTESTLHHYSYPDGTPDSILVWRRVRTQVFYREEDTPVTVNGLRVEVRLEGHGGQTKRIAAGAVRVARSNMTVNNLHVTVRDPEATMSALLESVGCVNNEFNNGYFSGATCAHLGYNILNNNVANFRYNHCISTNSRKGMDGRHGKNIHVNGGYYNIIDDHYGRNYVIRDVVLSGMSVHVPGDSTPRADLQAWEFRPRTALSFNGANFHIENITLARGVQDVMGVRGDIGDLYGNVVLRDVTVRGGNGPVHLFRHDVDRNFDYAHDIRVPARLTIENVVLEGGGGAQLVFGNGFGDRPYGPVHVRNAPIAHVFSSSPETHFTECVFEDARFYAAGTARFHFKHCAFTGENEGLTPENVGMVSGNVATGCAELPFTQP